MKIKDFRKKNQISTLLSSYYEQIDFSVILYSPVRMVHIQYIEEGPQVIMFCYDFVLANSRMGISSWSPLYAKALPVYKF